MAFLKFIFLLLVAIPFALFLLFILDRLMDELNHGLPKDWDDSSTKQRVVKRRSEGQKRTAVNKGDTAARKGDATVRKGSNAESREERRKKRKARKERKERKARKKTDE